MDIFHQLRWKLTLSYTLVTISAIQVVLLVIAGLFLTRLFVPENNLSPDVMIDEFMKSDTYLLWSLIFYQSPVDPKLITLPGAPLVQRHGLPQETYTV